MAVSMKMVLLQEKDRQKSGYQVLPRSQHGGAMMHSLHGMVGSTKGWVRFLEDRRPFQRNAN